MSANEGPSLDNTKCLQGEDELDFLGFEAAQDSSELPNLDDQLGTNGRGSPDNLLEELRREDDEKEEVKAALSSPPRHCKITEIDEDTTPEWEAMPSIPEHWRPLPLFVARNVPLKDEIGETELQALIESVPGLHVHSIAFDDRPSDRMQGRRSALVRLKPLPLPWEAKPEIQGSASPSPASPGRASGSPGVKRQRVADGGTVSDGDVLRAASLAVQRLRSQEPPLTLDGETVAFELSSLQVQLYIGNLSAEWQEDEAFVAAMGKYGPLERAFVMRNPDGLSKGYGFVEYSLPGSALACKQAMDEIERKMRPDPRKPKDLQKPRSEVSTPVKDGDESSPAQALRAVGWPESSGRLVKLLRAEWAIMRSIDALFSRVLYVTNLRTSNSSQQQLRDIFRHFGKIAEVTVPINKATNYTKGFAFVAFCTGLAADRAYRALEQSGSEEIGGALVSFANSAKATDMQSRQGGGGKQLATANRPQTAAGLRGASAMGRGMPGRAGALNMAAVRAQMAGQAQLAGRGMGRMPGVENADILQQQRLRVQAGMAAHVQMARQMELRLQQQMQAQQVQLQAQMQAQLRQAQVQVQQMQAQAQQLQRQAAQAQAKAAAELDARKRVEEEVRRAAAARLDSAKRGPAHYGGFAGGGEAGRAAGGYGAPGYGAGASMGGAASGKFGMGAAGYGHASAGGSAGYGGQGYGSHGGTGYGDTYGSQGFGASDYGYGAGGDYPSGDGGPYSQHAAAYDGPDGYGGYDGPAGYGGYGGGESRPDAAGYGGGTEYGAAGYGQGADGYGLGEAGYEQHGAYSSSYGGPAGVPGAKRPNPYQQAGYSHAGYGSQGGGDFGKRARY